MYSLYSNCPPLACTHARSRLRHSRTAESIIRWSRSFQAGMIRLQRSSTSRTFALYTISCMHSHILQSTRFRSGLLGGHSVGLMQTGVSFLRSATVSRALCAGASSCWKIQRIFEYQIESIPRLKDFCSIGS